MVAELVAVTSVTVQVMSQPGPAGMGHASGNIRAAILLMPLLFFRGSGA
jgi:hypothetical protein